MKLLYRRILYITFIAAFLTITPLLILYANGYQLSLKNKGLVKTGMFILDSEPRGALVYINNQPQTSFLDSVLPGTKNYLTTPVKIKSLTPGDYEVRLELDGYWPWQKKLKINPGASTYAEDILLFKKDLPIPLVNGKIQKISYSPDAVYCALYDGKWRLANLDDGSIKDLAVIKSADAQIDWAADGSKLLIGKYLVETTDGAVSDLAKIIDKDKYNLKFNRQASNLIYFQNKNRLFLYDNLNQEQKPLLTPNQQGDYTINDYLIKKDFLILEADTGNKSYLEIYKTDTTMAGRLDLPESDNYRFINPDHQLVNLYDQIHKRLYLIDPLSPLKPLTDTLDNVTMTRWLTPAKLFYANDFEIWLYDLDKKENKLLTRLSDQIKQVAWHPSNNYIVYSTGQTINVIELDERVRRNFTELIKLKLVSDLQLSHDGNDVYFYTEIGQVDGLYKLNLQ
jgi:hypothetical protein